MNIELNISKKMFTPKFYPLLYDYSHRWEVYMGSAGSSKSYFITQKIILKALKSKRRVLIARRYGSTIKNSTFALFKEILGVFKLTALCNINKTDFSITLPNGSELIFIGLDNEEKLLSITNISDVFIEEVFEVTRDVVEQLNLRMRGKAENQQIFCAFNPISKQSWLYDFCEVNSPKSFRYTHSTFRDNPFLPKAYIEALEDLYITNPAKARIYADGNWGVAVEGLVYKNWTEQTFDPQEIASLGYKHRVGCDLGWVDASTIVSTLYDEVNKTIYVYQDYYKSGATLDELVIALKERKLEHTLIYADSADPRAIAYFRRNGFRVEGSKKGAGSVETGTGFIQDHTLIIHPNCVDVIRELENYSYIKSRQTNEYTNDTTHEFSHTLDALRYAYSDLYSSTRVNVLNKNLLGF